MSTAQSSSPPSALQALQEEIPSLLENSAHFHVQGPIAAPLVTLTPNGHRFAAHTTAAEVLAASVGPPVDGAVRGPWEVTVDFVGPEPSAYGHPLSVRVTVDRDWPRSPPTVRFACIIYHFMMNGGGRDARAPHEMFDEYLRKLAESNGGDFSLHTTLGAINHFLRYPLHPCDTCNSNYKFVGHQNYERWHAIDTYAPMRRSSELFDPDLCWDEKNFDPGFNALFAGGFGSVTRDSVISLGREVAAGVVAFPMFSTAFCDLFLDELDNYYASKLPIRRPNSMNNYGIIVNEIGLEASITALQQRFLQPIAAALFPLIGARFDSHHSFMVQYKQGEDLGLDMHTDDSDVTFNVCLGREFEAAGLTFCGGVGSSQHRQFSTSYKHVKGWCVVHLGTHRHGADDLTSGERNNLIIWNHNAAFRASAAYNLHEKRYEQEAAEPDRRCLSYTHDKDWLTYNDTYPVGKLQPEHPWCPPQGMEYAGSPRPRDDIEGAAPPARANERPTSRVPGLA